MNRLVLLACLLATFITLAGCTTPSEDPSPAVTSDLQPPATQPSPSASPQESFEVVDALGRQIHFEAPPKRIVMAGRGLIMIADAVYVFPQAAERIVAIGKTGQYKGDFVPMIDPAYDRKTILESEAGPEQIAATQPDLVLLKSFMAEKLGKSIESLGIPVVYLDFETPEQYQRDMAVLGVIFQDEARARQVSAFYEERVAKLAKALDGVRETEKPRVLLLFYNDRDGQVAFNIPPVSWMQTQMVEMAGGIPVWKDVQLENGWTKVNFEQVAAWDPDQIYIVAYFNDVGEVTANLKADPQWQALSAVKGNRLYGFPADVYSWDQPDTRWILGLTWLGSKLHPDRYPDLDIQQEMFTFYQQLYGLDQATVQLDILPSLKGDV